MRTKTTLAMVALAVMTTASSLAMADRPGQNGGGQHYGNRGNTYVQHNNYNRGYNGNNYNRNNYNRGYNNYNRGGNWNGNGWGYAGAAIAGALIGGAIANSYSAPVYGGGYNQPYYAPAPVYTPPVYAVPPTYVPAPVAPRWHWEQQYDPSCNCVRNIQVLD